MEEAIILGSDECTARMYAVVELVEAMYMKINNVSLCVWSISSISWKSYKRVIALLQRNLCTHLKDRLALNISAALLEKRSASKSRLVSG